MNRSHRKNIAYQQQINHLAHAQAQALKILVEQQQPCKLNIENALAYYDLVKVKLGPQQFPEFLEIMRENRNPNSDCMVIISKICHLFKNYPDLLHGFGMFLPPSINLQVQTAGRFLVKGEKNEIFPLFIKTEDEYDPNRSTESTLTAVSEIDSAMEDLLDDNEEPEKSENIFKETENIFKETENISKETENISKETENIFKETENISKETEHISKETEHISKEPENISKEPENNPKITKEPSFALIYITKVKERFKNQPEMYPEFVEILDSVSARKKAKNLSSNEVEMDIFNSIKSLLVGHDDLIEEFKCFLPEVFSESPKQNQIPDDPKPEIELQTQNEDSIPVKNSSDTGFSKYSLINDPSLASVGKYGSYNEHLFFDKVRAALYHKEVYDNFLRCLMLFNEDVVTRSGLLKIATSFLGKFPDLLKEFKDMLGFKESGNNIEAIPLKIIKYENSRLDPEIALDIDYATGGRNGASYRALAKDAKQLKCSGRTVLCKEVLNDTWVSFPSWSEDSTFVTSCKTEYEEMIYRCEDERFELDMAIRANAYTIQVLENVQKKINKMTPEEKSVFALDNTLGGTSTVLHQKALHRCYGDKTDELVEGLKRNPCVAVPIILKRLRNKEEEWKEKQKHFNNVWREQIDNYYIKSLDHQGINFKQNDSKSFRSKSLLNEMEMVFAEKKESSVASCSPFHFLLEFKEKCIFFDAINLICQYLKRLPGVFRDDRRRIELVARHFIPDFFCFPRTTTIEDETVDENDDDNDDDDDDEEESVEEIEEENEAEETEQKPQESMDIENDPEERSGHTSPSDSAALSKDEELSDADESNSIEENEMSDESEKNSFIEDSDIFDKLDTVLPTNLPYALFFVSKHWYVFFRQFHILCERLARLLHESNRKDVPAPVKADASVIDGEVKESKPSYTELISKLSQLLSGAIDYSQFEDQARSLFGIHAFVCFTMDKLILNIIRQLQQIIGDDICKQCTAFFFHHNKIMANGTYSSPLESAQVEKNYLKKVERIMNDEMCFKILWHKKERTLTIERIEHVIEHVDDPYEVEKWSNYLDAYVTEDNIAEEILTETPGLPVFLPRNLRRQKDFWKRKVVSVENLWKKRYSPNYLEKNLPVFRKRKAFEHSSPIPHKIGPLSKQKLDESMSVCSETYTESENVTKTNLSQSTTQEIAEHDKSFDPDKFEEISNLREIENIEEKFVTDMEIEDTLNDLSMLESSNLSADVECKDLDSINSFTTDKSFFLCNTNEISNEGSLFFSDITKFAVTEKGDNDTLDSIEGNLSLKEDEQNIDMVAAFHDITDEVSNDAVIDVNQEETLVITIEDSDNEGNVLSDTDSVDLIEQIIESKDSESKDSEFKDSESKDSESKDNESKNIESKDVETKDKEYKNKETKDDESKDNESKNSRSKDIESRKYESKNTKLKQNELQENESQDNETQNNESQDNEMQNNESQDNETRPRRERAAKKSQMVKYRKNRPSQEYVRRRSRRNAAKAQKEKKAKNTHREWENFDYATFDYTYFSELSEEEKYEYLAMQHLLLIDNTEGNFKRETCKLMFVQKCDMILYRANCLTKAKEIHQQICETKTSNFNEWHRVWLDRYVTPAMLKFCNDWFLKSDPGKFKIFCTVSDCSKAPYIPYSMYKVRYYKTDS